MISFSKFFLTVILLLHTFTFISALRLNNDENDTDVNDDDGSRACVSLVQYKHRDCGGNPIKIRNYTVWTQPGSSCKHTDNMGDNSITNEYCSGLDGDADTPTLHQKVYVKNKSCHVKWYQKAYSPQKLTYTANKCTYGYKLNFCIPGVCEHPTPPVSSTTDDNELVSTTTTTTTAA